jgi:riboflavin kinase/FMN adenylyltransferase
VKTLVGPWDEWSPSEVPTSVTVGVLDGVHRGHRRLLERLDPGMLRTVLTFDPHPVEILRPGTPPRLITTLDERLRLLESEGVGCVGVLDLASIKEQSPEEFVEKILRGKLQGR